MKVIRQIMLVGLCFVFLFLFAGCNSILDTTASKEKEIVCDEHNFKVTLPSGWKEVHNLNEAASIQASNLRKDIHFIVKAESKDNVSDDFTLEDYKQILFENQYPLQIKNIDIGESNEIKINSFPAIQTVISGEVNNFKATYLVTLVESQNYVFQILAWSLKKSFDEHSEELHEITNSIKIDDTKVTATEKPDDNESDASEKVKTLTSTDDICSISVPEIWKEANLGAPSAVLQVAKFDSNLFMLIINEAKDNFSDGTTLQDYYDTVISLVATQLINMEIGDPINTEINGMQAIQVDLHGEANKVKLSYLLTCVESEEYFHRVLCWSLQSNYDDNKETFMQIADSFTVN